MCVLVYPRGRIVLYFIHYLRCNTFFFFFFNDTATTEIYTLSLHDALPICQQQRKALGDLLVGGHVLGDDEAADRKSTRLNSSHLVISYAVFCLKKKKTAIT